MLWKFPCTFILGGKKKGGCFPSLHAKYKSCSFDHAMHVPKSLSNTAYWCPASLRKAVQSEGFWSSQLKRDEATENGRHSGLCLEIMMQRLKRSPHAIQIEQCGIAVRYVLTVTARRKTLPCQWSCSQIHQSHIDLQNKQKPRQQTNKQNVKQTQQPTCHRTFTKKILSNNTYLCSDPEVKLCLTRCFPSADQHSWC